MKAINQRALQTALPRAGSWYVVLAFSVVFTACGAKSQQNGNSQEPSTGGAAALGGGSALSGNATGGTRGNPSGGAESGGTHANANGGASSGGTLSNASGGVTVQAGGATGDAGQDDGGQANSCDLTLVSNAVRLASIGNNLGYCYMSKDPTAASPDQPWGAIIIDAEGRVVVATGSAQSIVNKLADERWPCYAGTTFIYWCSIPG